MTKSFTAMAVVKLRDEGKLSLEDPVARYITELSDLPYPTRDARAITIRDLLTHSEGFPEDNPWGDQQLAQPRETMSAWMRAGISFLTDDMCEAAVGLLWRKAASSRGWRESRGVR